MVDKSIDKSIENIKEFVEELEKKIYKSDTTILTIPIEEIRDVVQYIYEKGIDVDHLDIETIRVNDVYVVFTKRRGEECSLNMGYSIYIPTSIYDLKGEKMFGGILISLTVKNPREKLRDVLRKEECKHLELPIYLVVFHEYAHLRLYKNLDKKDLEKYEVLLNKIREYREKISLADSENRKKIFSELVKFYEENVHHLSALTEVYAYSAGILGLVQLLKKGKISIDDARNVFTNNILAFYIGALEFERNRAKLREDYSEKSLEYLKYLDYRLAYYIISSFLYTRLGDNIYKLTNNFEENIDTIEELFKELMQYAEKKFLEELRKIDLT